MSKDNVEAGTEGTGPSATTCTVCACACARRLLASHVISVSDNNVVKQCSCVGARRPQGAYIDASRAV